MGIKSTLIKPYAAYQSFLVKRMRKQPLRDQKKWFEGIIGVGRDSAFGRDHQFESIKSHKDYVSKVPIRDYEQLRPYIDRMVAGEPDVLWRGKPKYLAKTSGTTSGVKYIPLSKESMPTHIEAARIALMHLAYRKSLTRVFDGKVIFVSGSPELTDQNGIPVGRLSGIVNHEIPGWLKGNQLPTYQTNMIDDWEIKLDKIVSETVRTDMRLISGIPPWVQMYYERLLDYTGKRTIIDVFPNLEVFIYGGVNYEPYRQKLESLVGKQLATLETYPASEGFIAFQDSDDQGLLLNTDGGLFYEFVPVQEIFEEQPTRLTIEHVELGVDYAIILTNNAGLYAYNIGDIVRFISLSPYRVLVTGRIKHFISAFGEHVIGKEVEEALLTVAHEQGVSIIEFTVAPQVTPPEGGLPYHEWFIEFDKSPENIDAFAKAVNKEMTHQNIYYKDLIEGNMLRTLVIRPMKSGAFRDYMKSVGKLGGQNKVPRLSNDRSIASEVSKFCIS